MITQKNHGHGSKRLSLKEKVTFPPRGRNYHNGNEWETNFI